VALFRSVTILTSLAVKGSVSVVLTAPVQLVFSKIYYPNHCVPYSDNVFKMFGSSCIHFLAWNEMKRHIQCLGYRALMAAKFAA